MDTFKVSWRWIEYAHGPGAESGQELAMEICDLPTNKRHQIEIPLNRKDMLKEIIDVAELYTGCRDDDPIMSMQAARLIKRAKAALAI